MSEASNSAASAAPPYPDTNQGPLLIRVVWVLIAISAAVILARLYTKVHKTHRLYWDDALIVLAWILGLIHACQITLAVHYGLGRHLLYLNEGQLEPVLRTGAWSLLCSFLSPMAGRIAFCVTLLFLAGTDARVKKWPIWLVIAGQLVINLSAMIVFYSQCGSHITLLYTAAGSPEEEAKYFAMCENPKLQTNYGYFQGSFNTVTDAFLTALPAILIEHTKLSIRTKIGLACLLCLSVLAMIASIVRTYEARALSEVLDYTHDLCPHVIWISIELNVVIIVSSIPLLRPLFVLSRRRRTGQQQLEKWDTSKFGSYTSKKGPRAKLSRVDSEEEIMPRDSMAMQDFGEPGIQVTSEVTVTYQNTDQPFVHAALVGLVSGEIVNPKLVKR